MKKRVYKKILIVSLLIIFLIITFRSNKCFALSDVTNDISWEYWEPELEDTGTLTSKTGIILGFIRLIGIIISVGSISIIGIKFMLGSVAEKANYKQQLVPWLIGASMVFAVTTIPEVIYNATQGAIMENDVNDLWSYTEGYDAALQYIVDNSARPEDEQKEAARDRGYDYGKGYTDALNNLEGLKMVKGYATCSSEIALEIRNGTITRENIRERYNEESQIWNAASELDKEKYKAKLDRLLLQMDCWSL